MAIPQDLYDAAEVDGATGLRRFVHVVIPLLANLYFICTLLATIWMLGDFNTPDMVSGGAPLGSTAVLATVGVEFLLEAGRPDLGVAAELAQTRVLRLSGDGEGMLRSCDLQTTHQACCVRPSPARPLIIAIRSKKLRVRLGVLSRRDGQLQLTERASELAATGHFSPSGQPYARTKAYRSHCV